ncbi:Pro-Interleukin-16 [Manis pentadactyla]|nr:Pro-Interleukin-16 [Manis pentadactyla]
MAAALSAHPSYRTSLTPGPPISRSLPSSFGLHPHASGLATRSPAPPEPRLLLVTVPLDEAAPSAPTVSGRLSFPRYPCLAQSASGRRLHTPGGGSAGPLAGKRTSGGGRRVRASSRVQTAPRVVGPCA